MAYEDITLTTSDNLAIKAYMIPARRNVKSREEMMGLTPSQREEVGKEALGEWVKEMGEDDAFEVCVPLVSCGFHDPCGIVNVSILTTYAVRPGADLTVCKVSTDNSDLSCQCRYVHSCPFDSISYHHSR